MPSALGLEATGVPAPTFALLIPTKNRHRALPRTIAFARRLGVPLVLCDQSATPYPEEPGVTVLHRPDVGGLPAARNVLLQGCRADIAVFLDDDTDLGADFIAALGRRAVAEPGALGWGPVLEVRPRRERRVHRLVHLGCFHDPRRFTGARLDGHTSALFGACFAVRTAAARAVGFDGRLPGYGLGEDLDFCWRLREQAGRRQPLRFCRELRAIHRCEAENRADPLRRGRGKAEFYLRHARRHGRRNPCTLLHLLLALGVAALGAGREPAAARGVWAGCRRWLLG